MFRRFEETDLTAIRNVHTKNHRENGGLLVGPFYNDGDYYIIENQNQIIAYVNLLSELPERVILHTDWYIDPQRLPQGIYIRQVAVDRHWQRHGVGTAIYQELYKLFRDKDFYAHVRNTNQQFLHFHLKNSFLQIGAFHAADFYGLPDYKAYLMCRIHNTRRPGDA